MPIATDGRASSERSPERLGRRTHRHRGGGAIRHRVTVSGTGRLRTSRDLWRRRIEVSHLIAITFGGPDQAGDALRSIRQFERRGLVHLTDTAVLSRDADGKIHTKNELDSGVEVGVGVVGTLGLMVAIAFPIAGVTAGLVGGAWAGSKIHAGVDKELMESLRDDLRPGTSALLLMVDKVKPEAIPEIRDAMQPLHGTVYETTLTDEAERTLREVVEGAPSAPAT